MSIWAIREYKMEVKYDGRGECYGALAGHGNGYSYGDGLGYGEVNEYGSGDGGGGGDGEGWDGDDTKEVIRLRSY